MSPRCTSVVSSLRRPQAELMHPRPHGQAGESLGLGLGGGQGGKPLEGAPQVWAGRPRPALTFGTYWQGRGGLSDRPGARGRSGWGRKPGGRAEEEAGSISARGRDRPPWPQIAAPGRPVRSAGSTGQAARPGPPPAARRPRTQAPATLPAGHCAAYLPSARQRLHPARGWGSPRRPRVMGLGGGHSPGGRAVGSVPSQAPGGALGQPQFPHL